jgi:hypothetical protein
VKLLSLLKLAGWSDSHYESMIKRRWANLSGEVERSGVLTGQNKRIMIPKRVLHEKDLTHHLGFVPVTVAVPEAGQTKLRSFRHPDHNYHIHEHGDEWSVHHDEHPSTPMLLHKMRMEAQKKKAELTTAAEVTAREVVMSTIRGMPHLIGEGVPGMAYYLKGRITGDKGMRDRINPHLPKNYFRKVQRMSRSRYHEEGDASGKEN